MATQPQDEQRADDAERMRAGNPPLSQHPAFPAIVTLWFAALLGLGTLVMPASLLERIVSAAGLPALLPAAAPPLGGTARALLAVAAAIFGAGVGVAIARRIASAQRSPASRKPIAAHEELGEDGFDGAADAGEKPLFGLNMQAFTEPDDPVVVDAPEPDELEEPEAATAEPEPEIAAPAEAADATEEEPLPFAAPSLARRTAPPAPVAAESADLPEEADKGEAPDSATAPLDRLGLVQLLNRLDSSLESRRERIAERAASASDSGTADRAAPAMRPAALDIAPADEAEQAMAAYFGAPPTPADGAAPSEEMPENAGGDAAEAPAATQRKPVGDSEEALRAALATLRRMNGTA